MLQQLGGRPRLRIDATHSRFWYATLTDTDDGVLVEIWKNQLGDIVMAALHHRTVIDAPMHLVLNLVHDLLKELDPVPTANWGRGTLGL